MDKFSFILLTIALVAIACVAIITELNKWRNP